MKRVKALLIAVCLVVTMVGLSSVALARSFSVGDVLNGYCPSCGLLSSLTLTTYIQASSESDGEIGVFCQSCKKTSVRVTKFWSLPQQYSEYKFYFNSFGFGDIFIYPFRCSSCGNYNDPILILGIVLYPDCEGPGSLYCSYAAADCSAGYSNFIFSALGHDFVETSCTPASCITPGSIDYECSRCKQTKTDPLPADPNAHIWTESNRTPATCLPGSIEYTCSTCQQTKTESIPALENAHTYEIAEIVPAEYDSDGNLVTASYIRYSCSACGDSYNSAIGGNISGPIIDEGAGGDGMQDATAALGKTFLSGLWSLFGIYVPGFSFTFGQMWLGVLLASISILVVRMIFGFGGGPRGESPRTSSTSNAKISKERRHDEF